MSGRAERPSVLLLACYARSVVAVQHVCSVVVKASSELEAVFCSVPGKDNAADVVAASHVEERMLVEMILVWKYGMVRSRLV